MEFLIIVLFNIMSKSNLLLCYYVSATPTITRYNTAECFGDKKIDID
jgi:hypothetical protein